MEDFSFASEPKPTSDELSLSVSGICQRDGKKIAYVTFSDATRSAEGEIPACVITKNQGFSESEVLDLQQYMQDNLDTLKAMSAKINPLDAFLGRTGD
ncbi:MAG: hypothetical protein K6G04_03815 [Lachnospiraceae bacterium]|nr:hypothetical protein [Lachnospiraceae bacterium]